MGYENEEESSIPYEKLQNEALRNVDLESGSHHHRHLSSSLGGNSYQRNDDESISGTINARPVAAASVMDHELSADEIISTPDDFRGTAQTSLVEHCQSDEDKAEPSVADSMTATTHTQYRATSQQQQHQQYQSPVRVLSKRLVLVNVLANFLMFAIAGFITYHCFNKATVLFSWHPSLMSTGYLILMSQAVLTLSGANVLTYKKHQKVRIFFHWLLQALAGILITIAFVCIVLNKIRMGKPHFQTLHGLMGLITVILTLTSIAGGVFTKYGFQLRHLMRPIYSKIIHGVAGAITYIMGTITIGLGIYSKWFKEDNDSQTRLSLLLGLIALTLYIVINPIAATISRTKTALRSTL